VSEESSALPQAENKGIGELDNTSSISLKIQVSEVRKEIASLLLSRGGRAHIEAHLFLRLCRAHWDDVDTRRCSNAVTLVNSALESMRDDGTLTKRGIWVRASDKTEELV
jgi:hypothetical protein